MFSLVLMAAMTQGAAAPAWQMDKAGPAGTTFLNATAHEQFRHHRGGCCGCCGGGWSCGGGCYGGGWSCGGGCYGGGGWSCCGGGGWSCGGGYGGGCYGGGCHGGYAMSCGGGYGGYAYGGYGSMSYGYAGAPYAGGYTYGSGYSGNVMPMPALDSGEPVNADRGSRGADRGDERRNREGDRGDRGNRNNERNNNERNNKPEALAPAPATLIVSLPADARLTVDGNATRSTSSVRTFVSPPLAPGRDFHYNLEASFQRDGKPVTLHKDVTVRAGEETRVNLANAPNQVASK